jgi:Tfp pilus assembly protein PilF
MMELRTADRLLTQKQCAEAADVYQRYLARLPKDHVAWNNLGLSYLCDKKYDLAVQAFQQALLYAPTFTDVHNNLGAAYMEMKDYSRASAEFKKALLDPNYPVAGPYFNLARVALMQGNYEQSRALAKKVIAILPKEPSPRLLYSLSLEKLGRTEEATDSFRELLKLSPENVEACYHLGMALSAKDPCEAQEYFRKVIDADPLGSLAQEAAVEAQKLNCKH